MNYSGYINPDGYDGDIDINITNQNIGEGYANQPLNYNQMNGYQDGMYSMMGGIMNPVMEPAREKVVYRNIYHTVPHDTYFML